MAYNSNWTFVPRDKADGQRGGGELDKHVILDLRTAQIALAGRVFSAEQLVKAGLAVPASVTTVMTVLGLYETMEPSALSLVKSIAIGAAVGTVFYLTGYATLEIFAHAKRRFRLYFTPALGALCVALYFASVKTNMIAMTADIIGTEIRVAASASAEEAADRADGLRVKATSMVGKIVQARETVRSLVNAERDHGRIRGAGPGCGGTCQLLLALEQRLEAQGTRFDETLNDIPPLIQTARQKAADLREHLRGVSERETRHAFESAHSDFRGAVIEVTGALGLPELESIGRDLSNPSILGPAPDERAAPGFAWATGILNGAGADILAAVDELKSDIPKPPVFLHRSVAAEVNEHAWDMTPGFAAIAVAIDFGFLALTAFIASGISMLNGDYQQIEDRRQRRKSEREAARSRRLEEREADRLARRAARAGELTAPRRRWMPRGEDLGVYIDKSVLSETNADEGDSNRKSS